MTFQFKTRPRDNPHEECEREMGLLKEYTKALEKENESRNEERKALQAEIERLLRHQREWKQGANTGSTGSAVNGKGTLLVVSESREHTQLKEQYGELKSKYEALLLENSSLTSRIITQDYSARPPSFEAERTRLTQNIRTLQGKVALLQGKLANAERELSESRSRQESASVSITRQYQQATIKIDDLQRQLRTKSETITRLEGQLSVKETELAAKEEQRASLQRSVDGYSIKIDALSDQLARLERVHKVETVRVVQREDPLLRAKVEQLSSLNAALTADNMNLRGQGEYTRELERRVSLLEATNQQLQGELRSAIEARNSVSRVQVQEDRGLRESVLSLRSQLQEVRSFNQLVRQENEELHVQIQMLKGMSATSPSRCGKCRHRHNKSRSRSPIRPETRTRNVPDVYSVLQTTFSNQNRTHGSHYSNTHTHSHPRMAAQTGQAGERYNQLQRKIQLLQSENQVLKQQLVHEI